MQFVNFTSPCKAKKMKYIIGTIVVLIILSVGAYFLADLWG
ncbi:hypothetical protein AO382_2179 [Moraxella catarrhalis]|uniref:Uncharacterized protein n=1 Tax=Moraxella catarrhalis TaxID=480 RepID=A0A7Z0UWT9_MORCA|nr:hypothetical protein AO382_2179 [Moraxella catarrhalis]